MRLIIPAVILLLIAGCNKPAFHGLTVKATNWPVHETRVCVFFGQGSTVNPIVGCWESEDGGRYFNKDEKEPDHLYLVDADITKDKYERLREGHNEKVYCIRDSYTHIACQ